MPSATLPVSGNTEETNPENRAFYPALDGMRAIAFFMVFFQHYKSLPWGFTGVDLFFVLSGFLITGILFDTRDDPHRVRNFYVRRTLRIFPLYYGVMLLLVLLYPVMHWQTSWAWLMWPAYLGNFLHSVFHWHLTSMSFEKVADFQPTGMFRGTQVTLYLGHLWSLCVEEQFYLVWPAVVFLVKDRRKLMYFSLAMLPACLIARLLFHHYLSPWRLENGFLVTFTPVRLDALLVGGFVALCLRGPAARLLLKIGRYAFPLSLAAILIFAFCTPLHHFRAPVYPYPTWIYTTGYTVVDLVSALFVLVAIQADTLVYKVLTFRPLRQFGRVTYGAYLFHDIPHPLYTSLAFKLFSRHGHWATSVIALACTVALSFLSFRFFETPFLNLKERWTVRSGTARA